MILLIEEIKARSKSLTDPERIIATALATIKEFTRIQPFIESNNQTISYEQFQQQCLKSLNGKPGSTSILTIEANPGGLILTKLEPMQFRI